MKFNKKNHQLISLVGGFTLIELTVVVMILGTLSSLGISNISKWLRLSKIDQASSILNFSLVECLELSRSGTDITATGPPSDVIDNNRLESSSYKIKTSKNKCADFFITPIDPDENILFEMGYQITADNKVTKIATPADNKSSLVQCKRWAGPNCGATEEQKAAWAAAAALAAEKKLCTDNFYSWLSDTPPNGGTGNSNRWNEATNTCDLTTYAFEGSIVANEAAVEAAQEAKLGAICNAQVLEQKDLDPPTTGTTTLSSCGEKEFHFCAGVDKQTKEAMETCIASNAETVCIAKTEEKRKSGYTGKWGPNNGQDTGPGKCNDVYWMCDQVLYSSETEFNDACIVEPKTPQECLADISTGWGHLERYLIERCAGLGNDEPDWPPCADSGYDACIGL